MKIKAIHTAFGGKPCIIEPRFFPRESGLQYAVVKGSYAGSIFACKKNQFSFGLKAKLQIFILEIAYWLYATAWRYIRHIYPTKIKWFFSPLKNGVDDLPF